MTESNCRQIEILVTKSGKRIIPEARLWECGQVEAYLKEAGKREPNVDPLFVRVACEMGHIYVPLGLVTGLFADTGTIRLYGRSRKSQRKFVLVDEWQESEFLPANFEATFVDITAKKAAAKAEKKTASSEPKAETKSENSGGFTGFTRVDLPDIEPRPLFRTPDPEPTPAPEEPVISEDQRLVTEDKEARQSVENECLYRRTKRGYLPVKFEEIAGLIEAGKVLYRRENGRFVRE